jgi:hypothetical protein
MIGSRPVLTVRLKDGTIKLLLVLEIYLAKIDFLFSHSETTVFTL